MSQDPQRQDSFGVTDHSATAPVLKRLVSDQVLKFLPSFYSPNALTLTGGSLAAAAAMLIWGLMDEMKSGSDVGRLWMMLSAVLLISYGVFDQLDGMQARKLGRSSPFGDFLDHWVDTIIANSMTVPIMVMLGVPVLMIWLMAFVTALAFWAHNWETRNTNYRHLPMVGGLESIWTALVIMTLTSLFGIEVWQRSLFGISLLSAFYWLGLSALLWVVVKSLMSSQIRLGDYWGFILALVPISIWLVWLAPKYADGFLFVCLGYVLMGMMATYLTGNLMRHLWLGGTYKRFDVWTPLMGLLVLGAALFSVNEVEMSLTLKTTLVVVSALAVIRVVYQGVRSYLEMNAKGNSQGNSQGN